MYTATAMIILVITFNVIRFESLNGRPGTSKFSPLNPSGESFSWPGDLIPKIEHEKS